MKVRELIEALQTLKNQDMDVFLQGDVEGNFYSYIAGIDTDVWTAQVDDIPNRWTIPVSGDDLDNSASENDTDIGEFVQCVVIYPSHEMYDEADLY